jgi:hypothetical protein
MSQQRSGDADAELDGRGQSGCGGQQYQRFTRHRFVGNPHLIKSGLLSRDDPVNQIIRRSIRKEPHSRPRHHFISCTWLVIARTEIVARRADDRITR